MKFDTAYSLSLDDKLSIYDVRDLNFDETADFDSDKDRFLCPNDECRAAFDTGNTLSTFNAKKRQLPAHTALQEQDQHPAYRRLPLCQHAQDRSRRK